MTEHPPKNPNPMTASAAKNGIRWVDLFVYLLFFISGAAALIYEISWTRQIGLLFGHTVHAASIVLASYFSGMAIGYLLGAKWSTKGSALKIYAFAEFMVAAWAFVIPYILHLSESSLIAPWLSNDSFALQTATRAIFSFVLLLPATIALGVTLPMIAKYFAKNHPGELTNVRNSSQVTLAYAVNTAGALVGVLIATFFLLIMVGVRTSSYLAAAISAACALVALFLARFDTTKPLDNKQTIPQHPTPNPGPSIISPGLLAFLGGFGILALQVLYVRMFSLVFHNSTYTFGIVVAVFLAALALGAAITSQLLRRFRANRLIGFTTGLGAFATAASILVFVLLTDLNYFKSGDTFTQYLIGATGLVSIVIAPAITCLGMLLPQAWILAAPHASTGRIVGNLTALNTLAAALGASVASFAMLVWIGLWQSIALVAAMFQVTALVLLWQSKQFMFAVTITVATALVSVIALRSQTDSQHNLQERNERIVQRWNSSYGWIDLVENKRFGSFKIRQNLHYRFGETGGNAREFRQANIPILLHKNPKRVLFLGLGTGLTAGGAIPHSDVDSVVAVELIPEVVDAVRMLSKHNYNVVEHPKVSIKIDDARHYLLANDKQFDVIISDLFVPWESETGYLYTVEHYQLALQRMEQDGLFCQWLPLYQLGTREFESIANSFATVFPHTTIWLGKLESRRPIIALIGTRNPIDVEPRSLALRLDDLDRHATTTDQSIASPDRIWHHYIGDWELQPSAQLNTDEHPRVEFLTPMSNRNRLMLHGPLLKRYFNNIFFNLPMNSAKLEGEADNESVRRRNFQRTVLFGD